MQAPGERLDKYDLAMLAGGPSQAALVALVSLAVAGTIDCGDGLVHRLVGTSPVTADIMRLKRADVRDATFVVRPVRPPGEGAHPVERAAFAAVVAAPATAGNVVAIRDATATSAVVCRLSDRLLELGLVRGRQQVSKVEAWTFAAGVFATGLFLGVTAFFLVTGAWWWYTTVVAAVVGVTTAVLLRQVTLRGHGALRRARRHHRTLLVGDPDQVDEVRDLGFLVALHGGGRLQMLDPALGFALGLFDLADLEAVCAC